MLSKLCDIRLTHSLQSQSSPQPGIHTFPAYQPPCLASKSLTSQIDSIIEPLAFLSSVLNLLYSHRPGVVLNTLLEVLIRGYND